MGLSRWKRTFGVWTFGIAGKALTIAVDAEMPIVTDFSLGYDGGVPFRQAFYVPYLAGTVSYLRGQQVFTCRYLDWTRSHASRCPQGEAEYDLMTNQTRNPLHEEGYIAVSANIQEVLPNIPHPPSPYRDLLGPRIMLDIWGHHRGSFAGDGENLRDLKDNGPSGLAHVGSGTDSVKLPDISPNPEFGGRRHGAVRTGGKRLRICGRCMKLHRSAPTRQYGPAARVLRADGARHRPGSIKARGAELRAQVQPGP